MQKVSTVGLDIAKQVFQAHGADETGKVVLRKKLSRSKLLTFFASLKPFVVALEACGGAHHWGRKIAKLGHEVRLIAPKYVKPFVKRQKNDMADAEAICEAAQRPTMRFVDVKSEEAQASAMVFRARDLHVRQRTQLINALRGHMAEFGIIAARGPANVAALIEAVEDKASPIPMEARAILKVFVRSMKALDLTIARLDAEVGKRAKTDPVARRLMTIPGVGPITATAINALAPSPECFDQGRDFSAWMGLTPRQNSTGGKQRLGKTSKMGERIVRRLLIIGAISVVRQAVRRGSSANPWLSRMLQRRPRNLVAVALANKTAQIVWAVLQKDENYRAPTAAMA